MSVDLLRAINASYRVTKEADSQCRDLLRNLGHEARYMAARLAIARSLSNPDAPETIGDDEDLAVAIKGQQLFGDGDDPNAWIALIVEHANQSDISQREFRSLVASHWRRGAALLSRDWEEAGGDVHTFVARLAEIANLSGGAVVAVSPVGGGMGQTAVTTAIELPVGPVSEDARVNESVVFHLNAPGGSPHMAIMGGTNSGKTYTATTILSRFAAYGKFPFLAFDFKGDLSGKLAGDVGAKIVSPPRMPVPLDVLAVGQNDAVGIAEAAARIRESIARVKGAKLGGVQADALREAIQAVLRARTDERPAEIRDIARALAVEYQRRDRQEDELTATLNELTQFTLFDPQMSPSEFFSGSWIVGLPQDGAPEARRLIVNMTLDSLDRWLNAQPDAPVVDGRQSIRHVCMLDEAHIILRTKLPALSNLIRMSRSKGGVFMLVSQSPDDFEGQEEGFLDNMGLTVAFNTQAKPGPTRRVFGSGFSLTDMAVGEALCRIRTEAKTRHIVAWRPPSDLQPAG